MSGGSSATSSNDLVRWLRGLSLPRWARAGAAVLVSVVIAGGAAVLAHGLAAGDSDQVSSAIALLTFALPVVLAVLAVTFGQSSDRRLRELTQRVLREEIPAAIMENTDTTGARAFRVAPVVHGCCADYVVRRGSGPDEARMDLRVELNVWKANVCFWVEIAAEALREDSARIAAIQHVVVGASREGYELNPIPGKRSAGLGRRGMLFAKTLPEDFLLEPARRLYFTQDLSFFVSGMFEATADRRGSPGASSGPAGGSPR